MAKILIDEFNGIAPKYPPLKLGNSVAQVADNVRLDRLRLEPMRDSNDESVSLSADTRTFYYYNSAWIEFDQEVYIEPVPVVDDALDRIVIADEDYPKIRSGSSTYRLGIPAPNAAPSVSGGNYTAPSGNAVSQDITYVCTYVDAWGYEGPPSDPSTVVTHERDTDVTVTFNDSVPTGDYNFTGGYTKKRLYRSNTGTSNTAYQYVGEYAIGASSGLDDVDNADLQEVLPSGTWIGPPNDGYTGYTTDASLYPNGPLRQIIALPGGVFAGFSGNTVCISEPYLPHAWPLAYRSSIPVDIIGLAPLPEGFVVLTTGRPFLFIGSHPSVMQQIELKGEPQACLSRQSIVNMGDTVMYASADGLCMIDTTGVQVLTSEQYTPEQWQATFNAAGARAFLHERRYVCTIDNGSTDTGIIFDPQAGVNSFITTDETFDAHYRDPQQDIVYIKQGTSLMSWENSASDKTYTWRSKEFSTGKKLNYSVVRLQKGAGACTVNIYGDDELVKSKDLTSAELFRLPNDKVRLRWEIEIVGTAPVDYVCMAENMSEVM